MYRMGSSSSSLLAGWHSACVCEKLLRFESWRSVKDYRQERFVGRLRKLCTNTVCLAVYLVIGRRCSPFFIQKNVPLRCLERKQYCNSIYDFNKNTYR